MREPPRHKDVSNAVKRLNPAIYGPIPDPDNPGTPAAIKGPVYACNAVAPKIKKPREMNKTERAFADLLEAKKRAGEILSWRYEGIRLKWGGCMHYCPDFIVFDAIGLPKCIEVKGAHIWSRDRVRFLGCRAEWPEFIFELFQWKKGEWKRLY